MVSADLSYKYEVEVKRGATNKRIPKDVKEELRLSGMMDQDGKLKIKGVSGKMLKRMKQEYIECPILEESVHFIKCFVCPNFQSRVTGMVLCRGDPLDGSGAAAGGSGGDNVAANGSGTVTATSSNDG